MKLTIAEMEMLKFFCLKLLNDFNDSIYNLSYLKFVFNDSDQETIINYLENLKSQKNNLRHGIKTNISNRDISSEEIDRTIKLIKELKKEFVKGHSENAIFIEVPEGKEFFKLLDELMTIFDDSSELNNFNAIALLRSIWLRMGPSDINDVNTFLKKQIAFIKNDYLIPSYEIDLEQIDNLSISYLNHGNEAWFETNRHIKLFIKRKVGEEIIDDWFGPENIYKYYTLPVIHCAFIKEDNEPTCYLYGIQFLNKNEIKKDEEIDTIIHEEKKRLRNKYVSPDFIIALKIFIDLLKTKGITTIKVPLLQVFNYEFHKRLSDRYQKEMSIYNNQEIKDLDSLNDSSYKKEEYENIKNLYDKYAGKEDIISTNKTERLINTFYLVSEFYDSLDIITEPFVESDNLVCKIRYQKEKNKSH